MIEFLKIPSAQGFRHNSGVAFVKLDGSNIGATWTPKRGFYKFQTRSGLFDKTNTTFGPCIDYIKENYEKTLTNIFTDTKLFKGAKSITIFGEFHGPHTFAGDHFHIPPDEKRVFTLFDVWKDRYGFIGPRCFVSIFYHNVPIAAPIYTGPFTGKFCEDVRQGKYESKGVNEGVVFKSGQGGLDIEYCKIKTNAYMEKLKALYGKDWEQFWE